MPQVGVAADQRHLAYHGLDPAVDRGHHQDVTAGVAATPDPDPARVHLGQRVQVSDGMPVVADLRPRVDLLARLPVAGAEAAVVEDQGVEPGRGERLGEPVQVHLLDRGEAVRHDHGGPGRARPFRGVEPAAQGDALSVELDVSPCHPDHLRQHRRGDLSLTGTATAVQARPTLRLATRGLATWGLATWGLAQRYSSRAMIVRWTSEAPS